VDFARLPGNPPGQLAVLCEPGDAFHRLRCLAAGRGAIIVPMHFGNWDTGAAAATAAGFDLTVVGDRFGDRRLDDAVFGARERLGMKVVPSDRLGPAMLRTLRRGGLLALLIDRPTPGSGISVPFFGEPVDVPSGPARLALRTGAAIVPVAFPRLQRNGPRVGVIAGFDIDTCPSGDSPDHDDVHRITAALMAAHESYIRRYPEQWYMFREMWPPAGSTA
jgi:KDO2-lipid IV(A) lauroyltransferase